MRTKVVAVVTALLAVNGAAGAISEPREIELGKSFDLALAESATIEAEALQIGFDDVVADSRCPKGERCVWEGDATVRVWLQKASATKEARDLHTSTEQESVVSYEGYQVRLLRLAPYPVSGRAIARHDYRATFEVTRGSASVDR
jgi:hypothetical protein